MGLSEIIEWHDATKDLPDEDTTVLIIAGGDVEAWPGYLDGDTWRVADGMPVDTPVIYWAHLPQGPQS